MKVENAQALRFLMQDDLFILPEDAAVLDQNAPVITAVEAGTPPPPIAFRHYGGNKTNFLILTHDAGVEFMPDAALAALLNTLKRKEQSLTEEDIALVNLANYPEATRADLLQYFSPKKILFLGINPARLGWNACSLNSVSEQEGRQLLVGYSFNDMMGNKEKTLAFWTPMKTF